MPKDDWSKYASKDRGRRARLDGSGIVISQGKRRKKKSRRRKPDGHRGNCRCCGGKKQLGRENICLGCYKRFKHQVHAIALREDRIRNRSVAERVTANHSGNKSDHPSIESEMTHK